MNKIKKIMKKLLVILAMLVLSIVLSAQTEKMSNYEKYKIQQEKEAGGLQAAQYNDSIEAVEEVEYDDLYYIPSKDQKKSKKVKKPVYDETENIVINYYVNDPFYYSYNIGRFYHYGFNSWMYANPYVYYDYWMSDIYMGYSYPYWNFGFYFGYNYYWSPWIYNHYSYNNYYHQSYYNSYHHEYHKPVNYGRTERPSTLASNQTVVRRQDPKYPRVQPNSRSNDNKSAYSESRRTYIPSYSSPKSRVRPEYNNSKSYSQNRTVNRTIETGNFNRNISSPSPKTYNTLPPRREYSSPSQSRSNAGSYSRSFDSSPRSTYNGSSSGSSSGYSGGSSGSRSSSSSGSSSGRR